MFKSLYCLVNVPNNIHSITSLYCKNWSIDLIIIIKSKLLFKLLLMHYLCYSLYLKLYLFYSY